MSSNEYNLSDNVNDEFPFRVSGHQYSFRYPLVEEIEHFQTLIARQQSAVSEEDKLNASRESKEYLYSFIRPVSENAPSIGESLNKVNIKVMNNFNKMVQAEFGVK